MSLHPMHETDDIALEVETGDQSWHETLGERWAQYLEQEADRVEKEPFESEANRQIATAKAFVLQDDAKAVREKRLMVNHVQCEIIMRKAALDAKGRA